MNEIPRQLKVIKGSNTEWVIHLFDESDSAENLTSVTDATLTIRESASSDPIVVLELGSGLEKGTGIFTVNPASFTDSLVVGTLVACLALKVDSKWYFSDLFYIEVDEHVGSIP